MSRSDQRPDPACPAGRDPRTRHQARQAAGHHVRTAFYAMPVPAVVPDSGSRVRVRPGRGPRSVPPDPAGRHPATSRKTLRQPLEHLKAARRHRGTFNDRRRTQRQQHPRRSQIPKASGVASAPASAWTLRAASTLNRSATGANTRGQRLADSRSSSEPTSMYVSSWRVSTGLTGQPPAPSAMPWLPSMASVYRSRILIPVWLNRKPTGPPRSRATSLITAARPSIAAADRSGPA